MTSLARGGGWTAHALGSVVRPTHDHLAMKHRLVHHDSVPHCVLQVPSGPLDTRDFTVQVKPKQIAHEFADVVLGVRYGSAERYRVLSLGRSGKI